MLQLGGDSVLTQGPSPYGHSTTCVTGGVETYLLTGHPPHAGREMEFRGVAGAGTAMGWAIWEVGLRA